MYCVLITLDTSIQVNNLWVQVIVGTISAKQYNKLNFNVMQILYPQYPIETQSFYIHIWIVSVQNNTDFF